jgi:signal peptidase I
MSSETTPSNPKKTRVFARVLLEWFLWVVLPVFVLFNFVGFPSRVNGNSMNPTLQDGQLLWIWRGIRFSSSFPQLGQVVACMPPLETPYSLERGIFGIETRSRYVKRIVGLPGDTLELKGGVLFRNKIKVLEPYIDADPAFVDMKPILLGKDQYFVMGDNRHLGESIDSRFFGPISRGDLMGGVAF